MLRKRSMPPFFVIKKTKKYGKTYIVLGFSPYNLKKEALILQKIN